MSREKMTLFISVGRNFCKFHYGEDVTSQGRPFKRLTPPIFPIITPLSCQTGSENDEGFILKLTKYLGERYSTKEELQYYFSKKYCPEEVDTLDWGEIIMMPEEDQLIEELLDTINVKNR